jgi:hypothetical protein
MWILLLRLPIFRYNKRGAMKPMRKAVSANFRKFVFDKYPNLCNDNPMSEIYRNFFRYLCFSTYVDDRGGELDGCILIPHWKIKEICKQPLSSIFILDNMKKDVLPNLVWSEPNHFATASVGYSGSCRVILNDGFDDEMNKELELELQRVPKAKSGFVFFLNGNNFDQYSIRQQRLQETSLHEDYVASLELNPTQRKIYDYLNRSDGEVNVRKLTANAAAIEDAIIRIENPNSRKIQRRILSSISGYPKVLYAPSKADRTPRLSCINDSFITLKREVRKAFSIGWTEVDLESSQFCIYAKEVNAPLSLGLIASGQNVWDYFASTCKVELSASIKNDVFKPVMYGIVFGQGVRKRNILLKKHNMMQLLDNPIINELLEYRKKQYEEIARMGYIYDAWNNKIVLQDRIDVFKKLKLRKKNPVASLVSTRIQSIEMSIIEPIYDIAIEYGDTYLFNIYGHQHDGLTISFNNKEKQEYVIRLMKDAVSERAKQFGITMKLESKDL